MSNNKTFFNEFEAFPAQWIRNYFNNEVTVDERSIHEINPDELVGFQRVHLFAGVAGWEIALRQAGWPTDVPVWSGSCPCQPFSAAGLGKGTADDRHLWPEFFRLIAACRPPHIFGEQVGGKKVTGKLFTPRAWERLEPEDRRAADEAGSEAWFRHVQADLERVGYVVGHCVIPACGVGAAHLRQRLYWYARYMGDPRGAGLAGRQEQSTREKLSTTERAGRLSDRQPSKVLNNVQVQLADSKMYMQRSLNRQPRKSVRQEEQAGGRGLSDGLADLQRNEKYEEQQGPEETQGGRSANEPCGCSLADRPGPTNGFWRTVDWIFCRDDKWRPVEPGSSPLAHGVPFGTSKIRAGLAFLGYGPKDFQRVIRKSKEILSEARGSRNGQLSGYGNAIVVPQATEFIKACLEETL